MANTYLYEKMVATRPAEVRRDRQPGLKHTHAHIRQLPIIEENDGNRFGARSVELSPRLKRAG